MSVISSAAVGALPGSQQAEFSLVLGGPLYQLWRGSRLSGDTLQLLHRRIIVLAAVAWVPLLVLSIASGQAWGGGVTPLLLTMISLEDLLGRLLKVVF